MPRKYQRTPGTRHYKNYTNETLQKAVQEIKAKQISLRDAAKKYKIHRNTLLLKVHGKHTASHGGQTALDKEEEQSIVAHVIAISTYGFPVSSQDLQFIVKAYLDKRGKNVRVFKGNLPGKEWVLSFLNRHKMVLSNRVARNINVSRAAINREIINSFFDNLVRELDGVPPTNIWNYDETNLGDDPGAKKVLIRRGTKYPEKIRNATKACTSLMFAGNAAGKTAPIYVVYKSEKLWQSWTENGPNQARYNRTKSGWFDYQSFEDWFVNLMLPILKKQEGKKVLIGDNLSSHLNIEVVRHCERNDISFIALPPNATHLLQPLDVAYFRSLKGNWRKILNEWKDSADGSRCSTIPKDLFPTLLKKLMNTMIQKERDILPSGFRKCGIYPQNREIVLSRLPDETMEQETAEIKDALGDSFLEQLQRKREDLTASRRPKRKRVNVIPGKSICAADIANPVPNSSSTENTDGPQPIPSTSTGSKNPEKKLMLPRKRKNSETSEDSDKISYRESDISPTSEFDNLSDDELQKKSLEVLENNDEPLHLATFGIIRYDDKFFPGVITNIEEDGVTVSAMIKCGNNWKWPEKKDELLYSYTDIIKNRINSPIQISRRKIFRVPEMDFYN